MVELGIEPGTSWSVVRNWPAEHEAGYIVNIWDADLTQKKIFKLSDTRLKFTLYEGKSENKFTYFIATK